VAIALSLSVTADPAFADDGTAGRSADPTTACVSGACEVHDQTDPPHPDWGR
jgi:hypothetical protein